MNQNTANAQGQKVVQSQQPATPNTPLQKQPEKAVQAPKSRRQAQAAPVLRFSPTAWAKLLFFRDRSDNEVGGFGITPADDLLYVQDIALVKQHVTTISVSFDDESVATLFETQVDLGRRPEQFARIWVHTHPGASPQPSGTDEATFARVFGFCQWAVMFVLAQAGKTYARLRFTVGPGGQILIPMEVDFTGSFGPSEPDTWEAEYAANVHSEAKSWDPDRRGIFGGRPDLDRYSVPEDWLQELETMEPSERRQILDELANRPDLWGEEAEVVL
jgi:proteasome lid subunit RPN8/RPN11